MGTLTKIFDWIANTEAEYYRLKGENSVATDKPKGVLEGHLSYLSGPIEMADESLPNWRDEPKKVLRERFGLRIFDPHEDPKQQWVKSLKKAREDRDYETMATIAKRFVQKDLTMVDNSNMLIAYLPPGVPTTGTHHEIIRASDAKKPVLLVSPPDRAFTSLWYYGFVPYTVMFGSWEDLYTYLEEVEDRKHTDNRRWHYIYGMI